ncbi:MAG: CPBP family intramembrane metalloprotease [Caulobacterales bacterium]|nr:CPBP family intramembrane metalloprotease [Caulobacterales bacterium]
MPTANKSIIFLVLAFAITWAIVIGAWAAGLHENVQIAQGVLALSMFGPAIAALICVFAFEKGRRAEALGFVFKPNLWWLLAWLVPIALTATAVIATMLLSGRAYVDPGVASIAMAEQLAPAQVDQLRAIPYLGAIIFAQALILGALINGVLLTISEELGWRGYLYGLWRPAGFWRASLGTGALWGVWHAPMIYLFGHNYPDHRALGVGLFVVFCVLLSPIITLVRERAGSVWAAGIFHGTFNALGGLSIIVLTNPTFPWNGIVGIGGFLALALGAAATALLHKPQSATA